MLYFFNFGTEECAFIDTSRCRFAPPSQPHGTKAVNGKEEKSHISRCKGYSQSEDTRALRLTSQLVDLQAEYANPCASGAVFDIGFLSATHEKSTPIGVLRVAERKGFEPLIPVRVYTISSRAP